MKKTEKGESPNVDAISIEAAKNFLGNPRFVSKRSISDEHLLELEKLYIFGYSFTQLSLWFEHQYQLKISANVIRDRLLKEAEKPGKEELKAVFAARKRSPYQRKKTAAAAAVEGGKEGEKAA